MGMGPPARGRVFLPPASLPQELHVNIGLMSKGFQAYPDWEPFMEHAISKDDYDEMMGKIKAIFEEGAVDARLVGCACMTSLCLIGIIPYAYLMMKENRVIKGVEAIVGGYRGIVGAKFFSRWEEVGMTPDAMGFDSTGHTCIADVPVTGGEGRENRPAWPPPGMNIILEAPGAGKDLRATWPKNTAHATGGYAQGVQVAAPLIANDIVVQSNEDAPLEKIKKLKSLLDAGALSQAEFDQKKAELMEKI
jgi:hypothetical protein